MTVNRIWGVGNWIGLLPLGLAILSPPVFAQIVPDNTLGTENSQVTSGVNVRGLPAERIDGGATRGSALYHSFSEFNVNDGQRVYFSNPSGIDNILTRVTGANVSNILGTLGVDGGANLFLLNPNGILFGSNAQLDIQGSFFASTGSGFKFPDGSEFSATNPQAVPLLTMSVTPGVQYGTTEPGATITNRGNLSVGEDLTLAGGNLDLQGQLQAGRDLTLQAQDTVKVRDSVETPFIASAGGKLAVQGNQGVDIFALNHPDSGLFSGGDMVLRSANTVGGDAHYWSGGNFQIETLDGNLGNLFSPNDPVIRASGDVNFGSYRGASLHILAGGSVTIRGNVTITGADAINGLVEDVTLSDGTTVPINGKNQLTLDIRAGTTAFGTPGTIGTITPTSANITVGTITSNGGMVFLTNQYQPNLALAGGNINVNGEINAFTGAFGSQQNGGSIKIDARGSISTRSLYSSTSNDGNGGEITLIASGNISTQKLSSASDSITIGSNTVSGGNGGAISLRAGGYISTKELDASSLGGNGGAITLDAGEYIKINGDIFTSSLNSGNKGGGAIALTAGGDIITGDLFSASSRLSSKDIGTGGAITISTTNGNIALGTVNSFSYSTSSSSGAGSGAGGAINVSTTNGNISLKGDLNSFSYSKFGSSGTGGEISLSARNGNIVGERFTADDSKQRFPLLNSFSVSEPGTGGNGGKVTLEARNIVSNLDVLTLSSSPNAKAGDVRVEGFEDLSLTNTNILTSGQLTLDIPRVGKITLDVGKTGQSGDVVVTSSGNLTFNNSRIESDTKGSKLAGDVTITSPGLVTFNNSQIISNTSSTGQAGNISIKAGNLTLDRQSSLDATTAGTGRAGNVSVNVTDQLNLVGGQISTSVQAGAKVPSGQQPSQININAGNLSITNGGSISASVNAADSTKNLPAGRGDAGNINISVRGSTLLSGANSRISNAIQSGAIGQAGSITLNTGTLTATGGASIDSSIAGTATKAGGINVNATGAIAFSGAGTGISSELKSGGSGQGGTISLNTNSLTLDDRAAISATTSSQGNGGNININARTIKIQNNSALQANSNTSAHAPGNISLQGTELISLTNQGKITSESQNNSGGSGEIRIKANEGSVILNQATVSANNQGLDDAGDIFIDARDHIDITNGSTISGNGNYGRILVGTNLTPQTVEIDNSKLTTTNNRDTSDAGDIFLNARDRISIANTSQISADGYRGRIFVGYSPSRNDEPTATPPQAIAINNSQLTTTNKIIEGTKNAGSIFLSATGNTSIENKSSLSTFTVGSGLGGNIDIKTGSLLLNSSQLNGTTSGTGNAGAVTINAQNGKVELGQQSQISSAVQQGAAGNAGSVTINTQQLTLGDDSQATVSSTGTGTAGKLTISAPEVILENSSRLAATTQAGSGGDIQLQNLSSLQLLNNSEISASTQTGKGGSLSVNAPGGTVALTGNSSLKAEATQGGNAGNVTINTNQLSLQGNSQVATSSQNGSGTAGDVNITASKVTLNQGAKITAQTDAGGSTSPADIILQGLNTLQLRGSSEISASTNTGQAGSITINTANNPAASVTLNRSDLSVQATKEGGNAGSITVNTNFLALRDHSQITANTKGNQQGANITLQGLDWLILRNGSRIEANAGKTANGGNINIDADYIIAVPKENSDITANAFQGKGGNIGINTQGMFGIKFRPKLTPLSDITASSELGLTGTVAISTPNVDPSQGLTALPIDLIDPSNQITRSCGANANRQNQFVVTGRGGLPPSPDDLQTSGAFTPGWVTRENNKTNQRAAAVEPPATASAMPLLEAQGMTINAQGELVLTAQAVATTPHSSGFPDTLCSPPNN